MRVLILSALFPLGACAVMPDLPDVPVLVGENLPTWAGGGPRARLARDVLIKLPAPPAYPGERTMTQLVQITYGEETGAIESVLFLSPETVEIVLTAPAGPRLATVTWNDKGIDVVRTEIAPDAPFQNLASDIFVIYWPADAVRAALPRGVELSEEEGGARAIRKGERVILEARPAVDDPSRLVVRNLALGYDLIIVSQDYQ